VQDAIPASFPRLMNTDHDVLAQAARWRAEGMGVALATVVRTWGSAPREVGSHMAVNDAGGFCGSVSGGCVEAAVVDAAQGVIRSGAATRLSFGVTNEAAWEVGLACGGKVAIRLERID